MSQIKNFSPKPANQEEIAFYCILGEAVYMVQELESALSYSITLKKHHAASKKLADKALVKHHRNHTLGDAIKLSENENLFPSSLQKDLSIFNQRRNWLIHRVIFETRGDAYLDPKKYGLFEKIKSISMEAQKLLHEIELDMVDFSVSKGKDMSNILAMIGKHRN